MGTQVADSVHGGHHVTNMIRILAVLLGAVLVVDLKSSGRAAEVLNLSADYTVASWTEQDGLPSGSVWSLAQDPEGYIWLGTNEGLVRFDGVRFVHWNELSSSPLPERRVSSVLSASDGTLWVGYGGSGGVSRIRSRYVTSFGVDDGLSDDFIRDLLETRDGAIWATSPSGLYAFGAGRWERVGLERGLPAGGITDAHEDRAGNLWLGTSLGVFRRDAGAETFRQVDPISYLLDEFSEDGQGRIWTTDPAKGVRLVAGHDLPERSFPGFAGNGVALMSDRGGHLWVGTRGQGIWRLAGEAAAERATPRSGQVESGLPGEAVDCLLEDRDGHIWVGTKSGLRRFSLASVAGVRDLGLVRAIEASSDGTVWAGTANGLVAIPRDGRRKTFLAGRAISALHRSPQGTLWAGTDRGLIREVDGRFIPVILDEHVNLQRIVAMTSDSRGVLWLCDQEKGVFRWIDGQLATVSVTAGVGRRTPYAILADRHDRIWIALSGGALAAIERDDRIQFFGPRTGGSLRGIYEARNGALWIAGDDGLSRFAAGQFITATRSNGLPGSAVSAVLEDAEGYIWAGVGSGIIRVSPGEFDRLASNPSGQIHYRIYDSSDGLAGAPLWLGSPSAAAPLGGALWFVTTDGVSVLDPARLTESRLRPRARIDGVIVDGQRLSDPRGVLLPPRTMRLQIEYGVMNFVSSTKIRFRYRLEGFDQDWIDAGTSRRALYTNLPPDIYRFHVVAHTSEGTQTESGVTWDFSIRPTIYQTKTFYVASAIVVALMVGGAWRLRLRQVHQQVALVVAERTRMSREIHDTLLQSLVGVALQFETLSRRVDSSPAVREHLLRIRMQVEESIREARQAIWNLRSPTLERLDLPAALRQAGERATRGRDIRFDLAVTGAPRRYPRRVEEHLLRIGQEAVYNAVSHAHPTAIHQDLHYADDGSLSLRVFDDGCGFDLTAVGLDTEGHYGLRNMAERADQIGGRFRILTNPGHGTQIETIVSAACTSRTGREA